MVVGLSYIEAPAQWCYRSVMEVATCSTIVGNGMPERGGWSRLPSGVFAATGRQRGLVTPLNRLPLCTSEVRLGGAGEGVVVARAPDKRETLRTFSCRKRFQIKGAWLLTLTAVEFILRAGMYFTFTGRRMSPLENWCAQPENHLDF